MNAIRCYLFSLAISIIINLPADAGEWYGLWSRAGNTWSEKWNNLLDSTDSLSPELKLDILGRAVALGGDKQMSDEKRRVFLRAQEALLAIPGHAEYYRDQIIRSRDEAMGQLGNEACFGPAFAQFRNQRSYGFATLGHLPSPETVRVLGELLWDDWKRPFPDEHGSYGGPMGYYAAHTLDALPLTSKPPPLTHDWEWSDHLDAWRDWHESIKNGRRTFRFKGDPTEYDLDGPAPPEKLKRIAFARRHAEERAAGRIRPGADDPSTAPGTNEARSSQEKGSPFKWTAIALAVVLLASAVVFLLRKKGGSVEVL